MLTGAAATAAAAVAVRATPRLVLLRAIAVPQWCEKSFQTSIKVFAKSPDKVGPSRIGSLDPPKALKRQYSHPELDDIYQESVSHQRKRSEQDSAHNTSRTHIFENVLLSFPAPSNAAVNRKRIFRMTETNGTSAPKGEPAAAEVDPKKINGKLVSDLSKKKVADEIEAINSLRSSQGKTAFKPHLAVIQVGNQKDSSIYVRAKLTACESVGITTTVNNYDVEITQDQLLERIKGLNEDPDVDAILVQLPLPPHIDENLVTDYIDPKKDVDGFHSLNIGLLAKRNHEPFFEPCTPKGIIRLLTSYNVEMKGKHAVIVGRSNIVGMPIAHMLMENDCTVTICHSRTKNIEQLVGLGDILVVAIGDPQFIKAQWVKPGAVIVDVGMNYVPDATRKSGYRLLGDVERAAKEVSTMMTPVPGGVGPMTVAMLLENTLISAKAHKLT